MRSSSVILAISLAIAATPVFALPSGQPSDHLAEHSHRHHRHHHHHPVVAAQEGGAQEEHQQQLQARKTIKKVVKVVKGIVGRADINEIRDYLESRDLHERDDDIVMFARAVAAANPEEPAASHVAATAADGQPAQSGALNFGKIIKGGLKFLGLRELPELQARDYVDEYARDLEERDDEYEVFARAEAAEPAAQPPVANGQPAQSGALNFGKIIKGGLKFLGLRELNDIEARDLEEYVARELEERDDASELYARAEVEEPAAHPATAANGQPAQSGALNFGKIIKGGLKFLGLRELNDLEARDLEEYVARELEERDDSYELYARAAAAAEAVEPTAQAVPAPAANGQPAQSGALNFGKIIKGGLKFLGLRELPELESRDYLEEYVRSIDELD